MSVELGLMAVILVVLRPDLIVLQCCFCAHVECKYDNKSLEVLFVGFFFKFF